MDGVEYQASFRANGDSILLTFAPGQDPPAGVNPEPYYDGTLEARIPRARASRLFEVETWALLHGRFPVRVDHVKPDNTAAIALPLVDFTPLGEPVRDERSLPVIPANVSGRSGENWFYGGAKLSELLGAQESIVDVPL